MRLHNRQVKASFWEDAKLLRLPRDVRTLFHGLWHLADDSGCVEQDLFAFKLMLFRSPLDTDITIDVLGDFTQQLVTANLMVPYQAKGKRCLFIRHFHRHQKLRSPAPPSPDVPLPPWIVWRPSEQSRRSGTYTLLAPYDDAGKGDESSDEDDSDTVHNLNGHDTVTVRSPYGDQPEPEPEPEPEVIEEEEEAPAAQFSPDIASEERENWIRWYERVFAVFPGKADIEAYEKLQSRGITDRLIIAVVDRGRTQRKSFPLRWAKTILSNLLQLGIRTPEEWEAHEAQELKAASGDSMPEGYTRMSDGSMVRRPKTFDDVEDQPGESEADAEIKRRATIQHAALREGRILRAHELEDPHQRIRAERERALSGQTGPQSPDDIK